LVMVVRVRNYRRRSGFTIPYRISRMPGTTHWVIWFGLVRHYQGLPTRTYISPGAFGLVRAPFTNPYHAAILGQGLPCRIFTNLYHRTEGRGMTGCYVGLELVVGGAVDEGDVVLFFIGQHIGTGCEVLGRPVWRFDRVGDLTGRLATRH